MATDEDPGRTGPLSVRPATLARLTDQLEMTVLRREVVRAWSMSAVERLHLVGGATAILKYAVPHFAIEAELLAHAAAHGVPVPRLLGSALDDDGSVVMIMEDLGAEVREAGLGDAADAAVAIHACPPLPGRPILDEEGLTTLSGRALGWLAALNAEGRWLDAQDIRRSLSRVAKVARKRVQGAMIPPFGMCHSEFHPTSLHMGEGGLRILDLARAYTGNGLLDLVSWQGTVEPLRLAAVSDLIDAYVAAGGPESAWDTRGGLPAHVWAAGWDKMWVVEWFLEITFRRGEPANDSAVQKALHRHVAEVVECLAT